MSTDTIHALAWLPFVIADVDATLEHLADTLRLAAVHDVGLSNAPITLDVIRRGLLDLFSLIEPHVEAAVNPRFVPDASNNYGL